MAEALLKQRLAEREVGGVDVSSCGLDAQPWSTAEPRLRLVIGDAYKNLEGFRSRPINADIVRDADLVLAMEESQVREILEMFPEAGGKTSTVTAYAREKGNVVDFVDSDQRDFLEWLNSCRALIDHCLDCIVEKLSERSMRP